MLTTSLLEKFGVQAVTGEYAGAETVLRFSSPAKELNALRHSCGVFDRGWRGKLVVRGEDRVRWLNGMVTNNTRDLALDFGNYNFVLNAQGRIQGDLLAFQRGEFYVLETEAAQVATLREFLDRYIIMDDVELGDISGGLTSIGVGGPEAVAVLESIGIDAAQAKPGQVLDGSWNGMGYSVVRDPVAVRNWYELWLASDNVEAFWNGLVKAGAVPTGAEALEWQRILLGLPRVGVDTGERELAQETGQEYALHHSKGCYIGQEIVERIHSRGAVHRLFSGMIVEGRAPERGSKVKSGEKDVGEITSSADLVVDGIERGVALGYVRREAAAKSTAEDEAKLMADGKVVTITALPMEF